VGEKTKKKPQNTEATLAVGVFYFARRILTKTAERVDATTRVETRHLGRLSWDFGRGQTSVAPLEGQTTIVAFVSQMRANGVFPSGKFAMSSQQPKDPKANEGYLFVNQFTS